MNKIEFIYCRADLARRYNPLTCLIAGDLAYWLTDKPRRWTKREDYAKLFGVSEATIKRQGKSLADMFIISRTKHTSGGQTRQGANEYQLKPEYQHLKWSNEARAPVTHMDSNILPFSLSFIGIAQDANGGKHNLDFAWFLCCLSKVIHCYQGNRVRFGSWRSLESWTNASPRTAKRYLALAIECGLIAADDDDALCLAATDKGREIMLDPFVVLDERREVKDEMISDARMNGMLDHIETVGAGAEEYVEWADNYCAKHFDESLFDYAYRSRGLGYDHMMDAIGL